MITIKILRTGLIAVLLSAAAPLLWAQKPPASTCFVAHLKSLALRTHSPELRMSLVKTWLERNAATCTDVQLATILANSPNWLGSALTHEISSILEGFIEAKISGQPDMMGKLYESLGKEGQASTVTYTNPTPRAPVVSPMVNNGVISGSANFGVIRGDTTVNQNNNQLSSASSSNAANSNQNASPEAQSTQSQGAVQGPSPRIR